MNERQREMLNRMVREMEARLVANRWRERMEFPSMHEIIARVHSSASRAYHHALIGATDTALQHAADAANLIGLMVLFGEPVAQPGFEAGQSAAEVRP